MPAPFTVVTASWLAVSRVSAFPKQCPVEIDGLPQSVIIALLTALAIEGLRFGILIVAALFNLRVSTTALLRLWLRWIDGCGDRGKRFFCPIQLRCWQEQVR